MSSVTGTECATQQRLEHIAGGDFLSQQQQQQQQQQQHHQLLEQLEQCSKEMEASVIDVPAQTARHKYLAGNTKDSSRANSRSRARPVWSSLPASLPAAKEQSSATGARSPR